MHARLGLLALTSSVLLRVSGALRRAVSQGGGVSAAAAAAGRHAAAGEGQGDGDAERKRGGGGHQRAACARPPQPRLFFAFPLGHASSGALAHVCTWSYICRGVADCCSCRCSGRPLLKPLSRVLCCCCCCLPSLCLKSRPCLIIACAGRLIIACTHAGVHVPLEGLVGCRTGAGLPGAHSQRLCWWRLCRHLPVSGAPHGALPAGQRDEWEGREVRPCHTLG